MTKDEKTYYVYKHTSPSGKVYIGITSQQPEKRWKHGNGYAHNKYFWRAIQKYGWDNFEHEILFSGLNEQDAKDKEKELIEKYQSNVPELGYNISSGGEGRSGVSLSEDAKKKISNANKGRLAGKNNPNYGNHSFSGSNNYFYGRHHTEESKSKIREKAIGRKDSDETKLKKSNATKGSNNPRAKITLQYDLDGNFIASWDCATYAAEKLNIDVKGITACCRGERKTSYGFIWRYKEDESNH